VISWFQKFAITFFNLCRYASVTGGSKDLYSGKVKKKAGNPVGLYKFNPVEGLTHSLKAPGFAQPFEPIK
jgi:hypothetical protein